MVSKTIFTVAVLLAAVCVVQCSPEKEVEKKVPVAPKLQAAKVQDRAVPASDTYRDTTSQSSNIFDIVKTGATKLMDVAKTIFASVVAN